MKPSRPYWTVFANKMQVCLFLLMWGVLTGGQQAQAKGFTVAVDMAAIVEIGNVAADPGLRVGYLIDPLIFHVTPEIGVRAPGFDPFPMAGLRVGVGKGIVPTVYGHYGMVPRTQEIWFEGGAALELTFVPKLIIGPHLSYTTMEEEGLLSAGVHAGVTF